MHRSKYIQVEFVQSDTCVFRHPAQSYIFSSSLLYRIRQVTLYMSELTKQGRAKNPGKVDSHILGDIGEL